MSREDCLRVTISRGSLPCSVPDGIVAAAAAEAFRMVRYEDADRAELRVFPDGFCTFARYGIEGLAAGHAPNFEPTPQEKDA